MIKLVERDSSSPASSRVHASLRIERSTRARSGECKDVGRARSRGRVPSCQRNLSYPQAERKRHPSGTCTSRATERPLHPGAATVKVLQPCILQLYGGRDPLAWLRTCG